MQNKRQGLLAAVFAKAEKMGISQEEVRESIAPSIIKKRLSEADNKEVFRVLEHLIMLAGRGMACHARTKRYESSLAGLKHEIIDIAKVRFGIGWEMPLNALCQRLAVQKWQWLDLRHAKAVKYTLLRLEREGQYNPAPEAVKNGLD